MKFFVVYNNILVLFVFKVWDVMELLKIIMCPTLNKIEIELQIFTRDTTPLLQCRSCDKFCIIFITFIESRVFII